MLDLLKEWDRNLFVYLNSLGIESYDSFWVFATQIESWTALFIYFFVLLMYFYGTRKGLLMVLFTILTFTVTILFTNLVKDFVARLRPNNVAEFAELIRILQKPTSYSFFSGHASSSFSITTFVVLALRKFHKGVYFMYLWPLIFVLSRIYVGVHYPSDILVGAFVGTSLAVIFYKLSLRVLHKM